MYFPKYYRSPTMNNLLIKSDRINTLRKQYDAFLEDDKKRKDRNEYILGRLEEMRSSSALVHHKGNSHANDYYYSSRRMPNYLSNSSRIEENLRSIKNKSNVQTDCMTRQFEPSILREISKKFILIPKLQTCISSDENYFNSLTENADTDWKSKYNILNELKKSEKETIPDNINVIFEEQHKPVPIQESINIQQNIVNDNVTRSDNLQDFNMHTPNYDTQSNKSNTHKNNLLDPIPDIKPHNNGKDDIRQVENSNQDLFRSSECDENDQYTISVKNIHKTEVPQEQFTEHKPEININMEVYDNVKNNTSQDLKKIDENKEDNQSKEKSDKEKFDNDSMMHQIKTEEYFEQDGKNSTMQQNMTEEYFEQDVKENNIANTEKIDYKLINNDDILVPEGLQKGLENFKETEPELRHIQNYESNEAPITSKVANAEINELENEQNQMFYTENSEKPYEYEENNIDMVEYSAENENFTTDQYPYQDESQQEQPYSSEINEHEESTERYDPNYEQQYTNNNYENVVDVPQYDNQQYDVDNSYEIQQDPLASNVNYEEVHPNNENYEQMQRENISYQNQEENVYNYENENYEPEQYVTNEQEYSTTDPNIQEQYAVEQEYIQMHTEPETIPDMEKALDSEDGYIDNQNTTLIDNTENITIPEVLPDETESSLKAT